MTEAFIDKVVESGGKYNCLPLFADTKKLAAGETRTLGHNYDPARGTFATQQIGAFSTFQKVTDEHGVSLIGQARISKRNPEICEAVQTLYDLGMLNVSFEIAAGTQRHENGVTIIDAEDGNE